MKFYKHSQGIDIRFPNIIDEDREKRTLLMIKWLYDEKLTIINEEQLVYDSKDLLAWIGGALGIFIGYSFFDFVKYAINFSFSFAKEKIDSYEKSSNSIPEYFPHKV